MFFDNYTNKMISITLVGLSILFTISAETVNWRDSGSLYKVKDVRVSSCNRTSCVIQRGGEYTVEIDFIATLPAENLFFKISASKYGFTIPLLNGNLCDTEGSTFGKIVIGKCPVEEGESISYKYVAKIPGLLPAISGTVNGELSDGDNVLIKLSVDIQIIKAPSSPSSKFDLFSGFSFFKNARSDDVEEPSSITS